MPDRLTEILLVEADAALAEVLAGHLERAVECRVVVAASASAAIREELTGGHDLLIVSADLPDDAGLGLVGELRVTNDAPLIMLAAQTRLEETLTALRAGATGWFEKPFDVADLTDAVREAIAGQVRRRREQARVRRLRRIATRIIREREDLSARMDLLCRDLVQAYRRLAEKVTASGMTLKS